MRLNDRAAWTAFGLELRLAFLAMCAAVAAAARRLRKEIRARGTAKSTVKLLAGPPNSVATPTKDRRRLYVDRQGIYRLALLLSLTLLLSGSAYVAYCALAIPVDGGISSDPTTAALVVRAADGQELGARGTVRGDALTADQYSPNLKKAIVAIEDRRFYDHGAVDLHGIARALLRDTFSGRPREGASTITQQLARLMVLSQDRTLRRKVQELLVAIWLEHHLSKQEILARYLNSAYFGAGAYGADAAAKRYFGKSARQLTIAEAAMIAGLVRAPSQLAPIRALDAAQTRAKLVVGCMAAMGAINTSEADDAIAHPAVLKVAPEVPSGPGYVSDAAVADARRLVGTAGLDLTARTTIEADLQATAEEAVRRHLEAEGKKRHVGQAALVAMGPDGAILAMVGGRDYEESSFNRAMQAKRQAGSLFKMFVYYAALQHGATPGDPVDDAPIDIKGWQPHNYENRYRGRTTLDNAFAHSINTVAAQLGQSVGIKTVIKTAHDLGVASDLPDVPSLALGTAEVSLMEMTRAYATIASDQDKLEPYLVQRITSGDKILLNRPPRYAADTDPVPAKLAMRQLLADAVNEGTGRAARMPFPTGGKTGTTQDFRDAWFVGSGPDLTVGVWVGNDDDTPMDGVTGGDIPAKIWSDFVTAAEAKLAHRKGQPVATDNPATAAPASHAPDPSAPVPAQSPKPVTVTTPVAGDVRVVNTGTLTVAGRQIRLEGISPMEGHAARALARHLRGRDTSCTPATNGTYRCSIEGEDLATIILANGGSEAAPDAPADLIAAQDAAQAERRGIWHRRR